MTLAGIRVLELGEMVSAPYATKLMADLGADVIKVEPPTGDRARYRGPFRGEVDLDASGLFLGVNTNKRSMVVVDGTDLEPLIAEADILVTNFSTARLAALGIDLDALHAARPRLVICSITPFGLTGPYAGFVAEEITVSHAGGWAYQCPGASPEDDQPPLKVFGHQTGFQSGMAAAMVSLAAFDKAEHTGIGDLIDFSAMAHTVGMLEAAFIAGSYTGDNPSRLGSRLLQPWGIFPCLDGLVFLVCVEQDQWSRLVEFMGRPEWTEMGLFDTNELRGDNEDLLSLYISEWTAQHTVDELWREGQARRICFAPVQTMADMQGQPHLEERGFVVEVEHPVAGSIAHLGAPFVDSERRWGPLRPAPVLDPDARPRFGPVRAAPSSPGRSRPGPSGDSRPLEGVRVLDLSWVWAGPYCGMHLGFLGAEVIKIESAQRPGLGRRLAIYPPDVEPSLNASAYFNQWDQGKLSCELDLSEPSSIRIIEQLVADSDVVLENFATGVMDRLGLSYERLSAINPEIIVASISGYGSTGPLASFMGYGPTTGPLSGLTSLTGYAGGQPRELGIAVGDPTAGITAGFAIAASLVSRRATGRGAYVDVSLWEGTASNAIEGWMAHVLTGTQPDRMGNRDESMAPHNCYRALGDDEWVSIACADETQWRALAEVIGSGLGDDARFVDRAGRKQHEDELDALITQWTRAHDRWLITEALQAVGVPAFASMSPLDLLVDPHLEARGFLERLDHPEVGRQVHTGVPWRSRTSPHGVTMPAPLLGQHTEYVLSLVKP